MDGRGVSGEINGKVFAVGVIPWCFFEKSFGVNVPGFNGKLHGRRNFGEGFDGTALLFSASSL